MIQQKTKSKRNLLKIIIATVFIVICIIAFALQKNYALFPYYCNIILVLVMVVCVIIIVSNLFKLQSDKKIKEQKKRQGLEEFDYARELTTYLYIGRDVKKVKNNANLLNKYADWKAYIDKEYSAHRQNEELYRFLRRMLYNKMDFRDILASVGVPIEITFITIICTVFKMGEIEKLFVVIGTLLFLVVFLTVKTRDAREEIHFLEDFIDEIFEGRFDRNSTAGHKKGD